MPTKIQQVRKMKLSVLCLVACLSNDVSGFSTGTSQFSVRRMNEKSTSIRPSTNTHLQMGLGIPQWPRRNNKSSRSSASLFPVPSSSLSRIAIPSLLKKLKRTIAIFLTSTFLLLGPIQLKNNPNSPIAFRPPSAQASSISVQSKSNLDKIVDEYVQKNMFNDDLYDPIESTYREAIADASSSDYPSVLSSGAQSILGRKLAKESSGTAVEKEGQAIKFVLRLVDTIHIKFGVSKPLIVPALFLVFGGIPTVLILAGLMSFSYNQKAMTERMAVERYGESVLDAEEVIIEDEDDDDEYGYDDDDDDEDEDDDDNDDDDDDDDDDRK